MPGTFLCEICCPTARQEKIGRIDRKASAKGPSQRDMKTFMVPDTQEDAHEEEGRPTETTETSFYYAKWKAPSSEAEGGETDKSNDEEARKKVLKDIKKIAKRIEGPVQKHPSTGKGIFRKAQDRYIAAVIDHELDAGEFMKWKAGSLSWWESLDAFKSGSTAPKGFVPLMKIAKVDISKDDKSGKSVVVKHKHNQEMHELVLIFATNRDAEEWSYALWEFISLIRGQSTAVA